MSITLTDSTGVSLKINAWNWGVFHAALERANVFEPEVLVPLRFGGGMTLEPTEIRRMSQFLEHDLLPSIPPEGRLLHDLSPSTTTDDGTFHREHLEQNYSLQRSVAERLLQFLASAVGTVRLG